MQPAPESRTCQPRTVAVLVHEWASGNNTTLADIHRRRPPGLSAAQAARALITTQAFAIGGGVSTRLTSSPLR